MEAVNFTGPLYKVTIIGLLILHSGHKVGSFETYERYIHLRYQFS